MGNYYLQVTHIRNYFTCMILFLNIKIFIWYFQFPETTHYAQILNVKNLCNVCAIFLFWKFPRTISPLKF